MDAANSELACGLVSTSYIQQGAQALQRRYRLVKALLSQRKLPVEGWDDATIELFINDCALMDSNNFVDNVGVGEREARVASGLVARRHFRLTHGIGRSGDVAAEQPKAAGSSLLVKLTNLLAADALVLAGLAEVGSVLVLPLATGMAITTVLLALRGMRPPTARYVLWPRVDQKTCLKSITAAGFEVLPIPLRRAEGADELTTDIDAIRQRLEELGTEQVACIVTTTSCFAPRAADDVVAVAKLCQTAGVPHIVNNAYGVQARPLCVQLTSAWRKGRVDCVVQSTDKNFMVPVGGAVLAARKGHTQLVEAVNGLYPGRASMAPLLDLLITLLHWGAEGWRRVLQEREELYAYAQRRLQEFAAEVGERVLYTPCNPISLALTLNTLTAATLPAPAVPAAAAAGSGAAGAQPGEQQHEEEAAQDAEGASGAAVLLASWGDPEEVAGLLGQHQEQQDLDRQPAQAVASTGAGGALPAATAAAAESGQGAVLEPGQPAPAGAPVASAAAPQSGAQPSGPPATLLGSMLFKRCVSGTRVVARGKRQTVACIAFSGYGAHCDDYPCDYLTVAAALGTSRNDVDEFVARARQCFADFRRLQARC